ncbi:hypothetical protein H1R20_g5523, partial [Candolleomyces eurysporus]
MSLTALVHSVLRKLKGDDDGVPKEAYQVNIASLGARLWDVFSRTYDLGFIGFGGPPVHFQIFHRRFVDGMGKTPWIDEQTYQELFAISQALPGPGSTKMLFNIAQIRAGIIPAAVVFLLWSLPAALAMFGLSLGVQRINNVLPDPVYALLSGLNASTVGLIALAAVQLARKAITDKLTRLLVVFGACAGLCYNALWYFPVLIVIAGTITVLWDCWLRAWIGKLKRKRSNTHSATPEPLVESGLAGENVQSTEDNRGGPHRRHAAGRNSTSEIEQVDRNNTGKTDDASINQDATTARPQPPARPSANSISGHGIPVKFGILLIVLFFAIFTALMLVRGLLHTPPLLLAIFNNMFLAGTIIFGGGPVVIPLLREYVVEPGWVSPRDFLLGLAIIQAMPGPNFNFAVYLGALAATSASPARSAGASFVGAMLAFLGIFVPGLWISVGFQSVWRALRKRQEVVSILRGVNAAAVGFVFTAVYRLWEIGYLTKEASRGVSLAQEPWWLVVSTLTFTAVEWFNVPPPVAILTGGIAGLGWWGAVRR